jgi:hypothetical protein
MKNYPSLADALADLRERGYDADFAIETESVCLYCGELDMRLDPDEFHVDEVYSFDCSIKQDNNFLLYAISSPASGVKGTLVGSIGTFSCDLSQVLESKVNVT